MKLHLCKYMVTSPPSGRAKCGKRARTVNWKTWQCLPRQAQCKTCCNRHYIHRCATPEQILAIETALHGIASVFNHPHPPAGR